MAQKLAPCGTLTAYNRHKRRKEDACAECLAAKRADENERNEARRDEWAEKATEALSEADPESDRLVLLCEQRDILRAHTMVAPPTAVAQISKQLAAVLAEIDELQPPAKSKAGENSTGGGGIDDIAARRAEREARRRSETTG